MGIRGLTTFISENPILLKPYKLHDSYVIIDGDNLLYPLYFNNKINVLCGGDYNKYAKYVRKYFRKFLECNVQPIIVFDGGYDKSGRKLNTIFQRMKDRLKSVKDIVQYERFDKQVLPILAKDLFICILNELNIPFVLNDYEADDQITVLANYYKCPVISADSDFFISDLQNGFILLNSIDTTVLSVTDKNGKEYKYLHCYIYWVKDFLSHFLGIEKTVLPLLGILLGNDYIEQHEFNNFFAAMQIWEEVRIIKILNWLKGKSLNDAINQILPYLEKERQEYVKSIIENAVASYHLHESDLRHIISQKLNYTKCEFPFHSGLVTPCGNSLPLDFIIKYHSGHYFSYFANVLVLHKLFLSPQIDDFHSQSSYMCARFIRSVIYGILIRHEVNGVICEDEKCLAPIEEYDRHNDRLEKELVEPVFILKDIGVLPKINDLKDLEIEKAKLILMKVLGINFDFVSILPDEWQLFFGSVSYWLNNSYPYCTEAFLYSLIVNFIYHEIISHKNFTNLIEGCKEVDCSSIIHVLSKIKRSEFQRAKENLKLYSCKPPMNHSNPLCVNIIHCYSQLQSCLISAISLNKLLGTCMKNPDIHRCLNGSLIYNLTKAISIQENPKLFVYETLGKGTLSKIFTMLESKVRHDVPSTHIIKNTPLRKSKKKSSKPVDASSDSKNFNINKFHILERIKKI